MENKQYDLIIIGSGPAGLSAGVYAQRAMLDTVILEKMPFSGGQVVNTYDVDNYLGFSNIGGFELTENFRKHADKLGANFVTDDVREIIKQPDGFTVVCKKESYRTKAVIIASGATHKKLGVPGEDTFAGKGVSYCATCDGAFFKQKTAAVVGGGDTAAEDAIYLAKQCKQVYLIHRRDSLRASKILQNTLLSLPNVTMVWNSTVKEITGETLVKGITLTDTKTGAKSALAVDGVFIAVGIEPSSQPFQSIVNTDEQGFIIAGEEGLTSQEGIFAAGDIRTKALRQVITSASDGANAVFTAEKYLSTKAVSK